MHNSCSYLTEPVKSLVRSACSQNPNQSKKARFILKKIIPKEKISWGSLSHIQILNTIAKIFDYQNWNSYVLHLKKMEINLSKQYIQLKRRKWYQDSQITAQWWVYLRENYLHYSNYSEYLKSYLRFCNHELNRTRVAEFNAFGVDFDPDFFINKSIKVNNISQSNSHEENFFPSYKDGYFSSYLEWLYFFNCQFILNNFSGICFKNALSINSSFKESTFSKNFHRPYFMGANFIFCDMEGIIAVNSYMRECVFYSCNLKNADLSGGWASSPLFYNCNLENSKFKNKHFGHNTSFRGSNLQYADFRKSNTEKLDFRGSDVRYTKGLDFTKILVDKFTRW